MRFVVPPARRPRHPLARAVSLVVGLAILGVLLVFGVVVLGVLVVGGLVFLAVRRWSSVRTAVAGARPAQARTGRDANVLEGEFVVIRQDQPVHR